MNYAEHNKEMAHTLYTKEMDPVIFTKCDSALLRPGNPFFLPHYTKQCEYETELVVRIGHMGRSIPERWAYRYCDAVTIGIDFTARDIQRQLASKGLPWDLAKGFDGSAAIGEWIPLSELPGARQMEDGHTMVDLQSLHFHLDINGKTVQTGHTADMIHPVWKLVSYISQFFMLKTGDLIYTGTPCGVGPVHIDDHLEAYLGERKLMEFNVK